MGHFQLNRKPLPVQHSHFLRFFREKRELVQAFLFQQIGAFETYQISPEMLFVIGYLQLVKPVECFLFQACFKKIWPGKAAKSPHQRFGALADEFLNFYSLTAGNSYVVEGLGAVHRMK